MARSTESSMDFTWDNRSGPVDYASPFMKVAANKQWQQQLGQSMAKKRSYSDFDSPSKPTAFPNLRQPPAPQQTFLFHQPPASPTKQLPPLPFSRSPAFNTPRKFDTDYDSSGIENPSSPENNADSEATPDNMGLRLGLMKFGSAVAQTLDDQKEKKNPILSRLSRSPGKGEIARAPYSHGVEKRRLKNRKKDGERRLVLRKDSSASDFEDNDAIQDVNGQGAQKPSRPGTLVSLFGFIETHPDLPHILSFYAQLMLNVFLVFFLMYIIYSFWSTIRSDVDKKSEEAITDILAEMAVCAQNYRENRCEKDTRMPALEAVCNNWERCMNKDPRSVGRARVSAHTFAEIFNSFVEPISYKAMIFSFVIVFGSVAISNFAFGFFRNKAHPPPPPSHYMQTPIRHASGEQEYRWSQYQSPLGREPAPSMGVLEGPSPVRRLQYG